MLVVMWKCTPITVFILAYMSHVNRDRFIAFFSSVSNSKPPTNTPIKILWEFYKRMEKPSETRTRASKSQMCHHIILNDHELL